MTSDEMVHNKKTQFSRSVIYALFLGLVWFALTFSLLNQKLQVNHWKMENVHYSQSFFWSGLQPQNISETGVFSCVPFV